MGEDAFAITATDHATPSRHVLEERLGQGWMLAGRYRVVGFLAAGGMAEVYEVDDTLLGVPVALKLLGRDLIKQPDALRRFAGEILMARRVTHPAVCRVFDAGVEGERVFYTMELHRGSTLARRLGAPMPLDEVRALALRVLEGLAAAHAADVVHADLKPSNVLLTGGGNQPVITDFGLALPMCATLGCNCEAPHLIGTPVYMAPEQVTGGQVSEATDLFSLGVILFEMVTGQVPWRADTALATAHARLDGPTPSPRALRPELPASWDELIRACLARDCDARPANAAAVMRALGRGPLDPRREQLAFDRTG